MSKTAEEVLDQMKIVRYRELFIKAMKAYHASKLSEEVASLKAEIERLKINQKYLCPHCGTEVDKEGYACERCCVRGTNTGHEFKLD